ncbi:hypothetical protein [Diaminobutyricimonas sp. TR449]|uniref:hypothetical protein n=1 Tax=Diaminobutyricimonas sp. TR449 TaxID=2708076 RepID=UPI00141E3473|nr:hypothetical protein [Diaminobutyricimonas sp. TR449]
MPEARPDTWPDALDQLERELRHPDASDWTPPEDLGPIPPELEARARGLLDAQRDAIALMTEQREQIGRHLNAVKSVPSAHDSERSVYLDVTG